MLKTYKDGTPIRKFIDFELKDVNEEDRTISAIGSTEQVDRDGDIIVQAGWKLKNFKRNPVVLWGHDYRGLAVGRAEEVKVEDNRLMFKIKFATKNENPMAEFVYNSYKNKFLRTFSVGFIPLKSEDIEGDNDKKGLMCRGRKFLSQELLELSCVSVPSNVGAVATSGKEIQESMSKIYGLALPEDKCTGCCHKNVIPFKSYPLVSEETAWDLNNEIAQAKAGDLRLMATWQEKEKGEIGDGITVLKKISYKLFHHRASDNHTVWRAVAAAMAALLGARGGVRVPADDRKGIYNHLKKHYAEFGKEAPEFRDYGTGEIELAFEDICYEEMLDIATDEQNRKDFEEVEEKRGRVLSEKNRTMIKNCNESIAKVSSMLTELLGITEKPDSDDSNEDDKTCKEQLAKMAGLKNTLNEIEQQIKTQGV